MNEQINWAGVTVQIDTDDLKREFREKYEDRFTLNTLEIITKTEFEECTESIITGKVSSLLPAVSLFGFGLRVNLVDFKTRELHFRMSPISFSCIRDAVKVEMLQPHKTT